MHTDAWQTCDKVLESNQKIQGLSSGESEFTALVRGGNIGLGAKAMAEDCRSRPGHGFIGSQRSCYEKRSVEDTSSSHATVMVATAGDVPRVADLEGESD